MTTEYGFFDGERYTRYLNAKSAKSAAKIAMKVQLRQEGKLLNREGLQACYGELAECVAENMHNDGHDKKTTIIPLDEMVQYFVAPGWITVKKGNGNAITLDNSEHWRIVNDIITELGVEEKEIDVYSDIEWEERQHEMNHGV